MYTENKSAGAARQCCRSTGTSADEKAVGWTNNIT